MIDASTSKQLPPHIQLLSFFPLYNYGNKRYVYTHRHVYTNTYTHIRKINIYSTVLQLNKKIEGSHLGELFTHYFKNIY